jgi:aminoglycoside phosphotransferase (APT) family kinase protein
MSPAEMTRVAEQVVGFQRITATLPAGRGYGWVAIDAIGPHPTWSALLDHELDRNLRRLGPPHPTALIARLRARLVEARVHATAVPPTPFLDDLTTKNVIVDAGALTGVVDFDCIAYGDPLYWLGLTTTAVLSLPVPTPFYTAELRRLWGVDAAAARTIDTYAALFCLDFAGFGRQRGDAAYADRMLAVMVDLLAD